MPVFFDRTRIHLPRIGRKIERDVVRRMRTTEVVTGYKCGYPSCAFETCDAKEMIRHVKGKNEHDESLRCGTPVGLAALFDGSCATCDRDDNQPASMASCYRCAPVIEFTTEVLHERRI